MIKAEKKALFRFLLLYAGSLIIFLGISGFGYYNRHSYHIIKSQQLALGVITFSAAHSLRNGEMPDETVEWAIVDRKGATMRSSFDLPQRAIDKLANFKSPKEEFFYVDGYLYNARIIGARGEQRFFIVRTAIDQEAFDQLVVNIVTIFSGAFVFFMIIAFFLTRLFLKPLRETIHLLDRFIKDATHELTTPISAILMSVEGFNRELLNERDRKRLGRIEVAARTLQTVYEDLAFVMLDARSRRVVTTLDLERIVKERVMFFEPAGRMRSARWEIDVAQYSPICADEREFKRILDNLLSNAIKYNKVGGLVRVCVSGCALSVEDEGGGISKADRDSVFERFVRLDDAQGGFGLGLSIVKELCKRNSIDISIADREQGGSVFTLKWQT
ncbi:MAG: HAMP domain-containing histidine kinase [Helicobacteraceae bacterium]|jgi:two-component system OmpR family sensor kinase|nr:HAMP domain-containing histidine kinase [Helicobacteraceae bacterium]